MYTTHGHHIPGTTLVYTNPTVSAECESIHKCTKCMGEAYHEILIMRSNEDKDRVRKVSYMDNTERQTKARILVAHYFNERREEPDEIPELTLKDVHIVWFSKTLDNWKALVITDVPDNVYYEVTYNGRKRETYLDVYKKIENIIYTD